MPASLPHVNVHGTHTHIGTYVHIHAQIRTHTYTHAQAIFAAERGLIIEAYHVGILYKFSSIHHPDVVAKQMVRQLETGAEVCMCVCACVYVCACVRVCANV